MVRTCGTHGGEEKCMQGFDGETLRIIMAVIMKCWYKSIELNVITE
jgi:hypothetical protein